MENVRPRARFYALLKLHYLNPFLEPKVEKADRRTDLVHSPVNIRQSSVMILAMLSNLLQERHNYC